MKRRHFIKSAGMVLGAPVLLNGMGLSPLSRPVFFNSINDETDRVLVLIQLNGGNDGLNSVIPLDYYGQLYEARPNVIIPESSILPVTDTVGFHPQMAGLKDLFDDGKLGIIHSVGYPNQNRSHFRSMDIWSTGSPAEEDWSTGWLGRYLDGQFPGFPDAYPNPEHPDPFAISMGFLVSETCQGAMANFSITLNDPFSLTDLTEWDGDAVAGTFYGDELAYLRETIAQTNFYSERIVAAANAGSTLATYPETELAEQLRNVALLIAGGLRTRIYVVSLGGFDTHSGQVEAGNPLSGMHAYLLGTLSEAVHAFQEDLALLGLEDRVIGMTFSEFGRQIRSNASFGTDHGTAAPMILFGPCVGATILGDNPEIPEEVSPQEGVPMQHDFRNVYGSVLMDWFEVLENEIKAMLTEDFTYLPVLSNCGLSTGNRSPVRQQMEMDNYPNPFRDTTTIRFVCSGEHVRLSVFDAFGNELRVLINKRLGAGQHEIRFNGAGLPPGNYYYRLATATGQKTCRMVKS